MSVTTQQGSGGPAVVCAGLTKDYGQGHGLFDLDLSDRARGGLRVRGAERGREDHDDPAAHGPDPSRPRDGHPARP